MSSTEPSAALRKWLHEHQLSGYLRVLLTDPWADQEVALGMINVEGYMRKLGLASQ